MLNHPVSQHNLIIYKIITQSYSNVPIKLCNSWPSCSWATYQICKIVGCPCTGNTGNVFLTTDFKGNLLTSDPSMHHGTCVTHVPLCMSGSLTYDGGENIPGIPCACAPPILRIWQEAHGLIAVPNSGSDAQRKLSWNESCNIWLLIYEGCYSHATI